MYSSMIGMPVMNTGFQMHAIEAWYVEVSIV